MNLTHLLFLEVWHSFSSDRTMTLNKLEDIYCLNGNIKDFLQSVYDLLDENPKFIKFLG